MSISSDGEYGKAGWWKEGMVSRLCCICLSGADLTLMVQAPTSTKIGCWARAGGKWDAITCSNRSGAGLSIYFHDLSVLE